MIRPPPRSTPLYSSAASDVYKRQPTATCTTRSGRSSTRSTRTDRGGPPPEPTQVSLGSVHPAHRSERNLRRGSVRAGSQPAELAGVVPEHVPLGEALHRVGVSPDRGQHVRLCGRLVHVRARDVVPAYRAGQPHHARRVRVVDGLHDGLRHVGGDHDAPAGTRLTLQELQAVVGGEQLGGVLQALLVLVGQGSAQGGGHGVHQARRQAVPGVQLEKGRRQVDPHAAQCAPTGTPSDSTSAASAASSRRTGEVGACSARVCARSVAPSQAAWSSPMIRASATPAYRRSAARTASAGRGPLAEARTRLTTTNLWATRPRPLSSPRPRTSRCNPTGSPAPTTTTMSAALSADRVAAFRRGARVS